MTRRRPDAAARTSTAWARGLRSAAALLAALACVAAAAPVLAQPGAGTATGTATVPSMDAPPPRGSGHATHAPALPSFAELEAAGARIGKVRIVTLNVFDTDDPAESNALFRLANRLHIVTQPKVIERALTFKEGDPVRVAVIDEAERVLRTFRFLYEVRIRPVAYSDGVVDVEVATRDTWTLDPGIGASRAGGATSSSLSIREGNLLGTGTSIGIGIFRNAERSGNEFQIGNERAFGGRLSADYALQDNSDGRSQTMRIARPFWTLDTRWAAGVTASSVDRIESVYRRGEVASQYRRRDDVAEVFGGWSSGRVDGWVTRWSAGLFARDESYAREPGVPSPPVLSPDQTLAGPFVRWQLIEDRFEKKVNRDQIGRTEFFAYGLQTTVQLGYASSAFGSTKDAWVYQANASHAYEPWPTHALVTSGSLQGQLADGGVERLRAGARLQYYLPQSPRWLFYASVGGDVLTNPAPLDTLYVGGDNGLRGYPLRYQSGSRRALLTLEERMYTDLYLFRLFRVGGAGFFDVGRAWGGPTADPTNDRWLANAGIGLRIFNVRASFGNVLHVDLAFPLNGDPDVRKVQLLVKVRASF
ncbi:MAG: hypothetical protein O9345_19105 [Burkholderiaceae bacterium]|nr:hypothetical protein [Burkholderiales bacterium]MCZ8340229.1 hypothetical protein [Burkholderiaceae bacterium]